MEKSIEIKIEKLIYGGSGLGVYDGRKVFVPHAAPGDVVRADIVVDKGQYLNAKLVEVIEPSKDRVQPVCPVFGECGGCQWQYLSYSSQLLWKQIILEEQLVRIAKIKEPNVLPAVPSPKMWNYRSRIEVHVDKKGNVGFFKEGSNDVVEFKECYIADEKLNKMLDHEREHLRKKTGRKIHFSLEKEHTGFTQVNPAQNETLRTMLIDLLREGPHKTVLELYCGSGNFTFDICKHADDVIAVDSEKKSILKAADVATMNNVENVQFLVGDSKTAIKECLTTKKKFDCIVVDPPRSGCREIIDGILKLRPGSIIYISCDPSTLARDVRGFVENGYELKSSQPIDMFPQTFHIESVSWLMDAR